MATQLGLYNHALRIIGERSLATLNEDREPRRVLDDVYAMTVAYCLANGIWNFAMRDGTATKTGAGSLGFKYLVPKPPDYLHLFMMAEAANFARPFTQGFADQGAAWHVDIATVYIRYTSSHADYGGLLANWPLAFEFYVAAVMASGIVNRLAASPDLARYCSELEQMRHEEALRQCQVAGPVGQLPMHPDARNPPHMDGGHEPGRFLPFGSRPQNQQAR